MTDKRHCFVLFLLLISVIAAAPKSSNHKQTSCKISGRVSNALTTEPLAFVNVYIDSLFIGTATGMDGTFVISPLLPGTYRLIVRHIGYAPYIENNVRIVSGETVSRSIALRPTQLKTKKIIVTATRYQKIAQMAPASLAVLSEENIQKRSLTTFDQALDMVSGISIHRSAGISVQSLSIRGSSDVAGGGVGNRVLLMIDGRPALTSDSGGALWSLVPTGCIDRVEVVKGAFSSLYGSTAMGGVINVITHKPSYRSKTTLNAGYGFYENPPPSLQYTDRISKQSLFEFSHSGGRGPIRYLLHLSRKQSDGHSENAAYEFYNIFGKVVCDLSQNSNIKFSLSTSIAENDYPHTWINNLHPLRVLPKYSDDHQKKKNYSMDLLYQTVLSKRAKYFSRFYYYRKAARSYFNENDPALNTPGNQPYGQKTAVDADKFGSITQFDYYLDKRNYLISGIDIQIDRVDSSPDTIMFGNRQVNNVALFLQDEIKVTDRFATTLGFRCDWNHLIGGTTQNQISPKWAVVYNPQKNFTFRLLLGQAFRAPSIAERFFQHELRSGTRFKPNPDLKPERMDLSLETGLRWRLGDFANIDIAYFYDHYRDMIYWIEISAEQGVPYTLFQVRNLNQSLMKGVEVNIDFLWKQFFHAEFHYTYLDAKDQSPDRLDDLLAYRIRHSFSFSTDFVLNHFTFNLTGRYKSRTEEVFLYPLEAPDAFFVANAKATVRLTSKLHLWVAVNNVFDTLYEELARYRMPGRNWMFGTSIR